MVYKILGPSNPRQTHTYHQTLQFSDSTPAPNLEGSGGGLFWPMETIKEEWNSMAIAHGLPCVYVLSPKRKQRLKKCWEMMPDLRKWKEAIWQIPNERCRRGYKFYLGENERGWKANFDWFINTKTPFLAMYENSQIKEPEKNNEGGYKKLTNGVDNEKASSAISDILRGIK